MAPQVVAKPRRHVLRLQQTSVERARKRVGEDGPARFDDRAVGCSDADGTAASHQHAHDPRVARERAAARQQPRDERIRQPLRAALRERKADRLPERGEEPAVEPARRLLREEVGVERVPREQPGRAGSAELLLREATDAEEPHSHEARKVAAQLRREPGSGADRAGAGS